MRRHGILAGIAVLACTLTLAVGWWSKARCLGDGSWTGSEEYLAWCYTDIFPQWGIERLSEGAVPYLDHPVEYPVLTGAQMWLAQQVTQQFPAGAQAVAFFHVTAAMNALLSLGVLLLLARAPVPPRRLLWWALAPALAVYAFLNWDPLAVLLLTAAIVYHLRDRDLAAGVAAGLGVAAKLVPGVVIPLIVGARLAQGRRRDALVHLGGAAAAWLVVNLPILVVAPQGWLRFLELNRERPANFDSLWYLAERVRGASFSVSTLNTGSAVLFAALTLVILAVGTRNRGPAQWWSLALPILAAFLLTNKVYSPQYSLWLLPLAALSLRRLAPFAGFLVADLALFLVEFPFLGGVGGAAPAPGYDLFAVVLLLRSAMLAWVLVESTLDHDAALTARRPPPATAADPAPAPAEGTVPHEAEHRV